MVFYVVVLFLFILLVVNGVENVGGTLCSHSLCGAKMMHSVKIKFLIFEAVI